jgi:hypothetical protein
LDHRLNSVENLGALTMATEMGEYVVGAYLRLCEKCDVVDYNARSPQAGLAGLMELDVIGLRFADSTAFLCEVATHLDGLHYGTYDENERRVRAKLQKQQNYASENLKSFSKHQFMFWSPRVPTGDLTIALAKIEGLKLVINQDYAMRVGRLRDLAKKGTKDIGNPFFRALQIVEHLKEAGD